MIYSLTVTNTIGESLTFELSNPMASGYAIKTIDGVGTPDMNVNTTPYGIGDGSILGSIKAEYRLITIILYPLAHPTVETARQRLYRYFQLKKDILLTFNTENRLVTIDGYVQNIDPNIFDNPETVSIEIKCIDPYFHKMAEDQTKFYGIEPNFEFPFSVEFEWAEGFAWKKDNFSNVIEWYDVAFGNGIFVGVGYDNVTPAAYSSGGVAWNKVALPISKESYWAGITFGNDQFIAIFQDSNIAASSIDGVNWDLVKLPFVAKWAHIAYGNNHFIAIPESGSRAAYSTDGIEWYEVDSGTNGDWKQLIFAGSMFIAFDPDQSLANCTLDGSIWWTVSIPFEDLYQMAYGNGVFVITRTTFGRWLVGSSLESLREVVPPSNDISFNIDFLGNTFLAILPKTDIGFYSEDGRTWEETTMPAMVDWLCTTYGDGIIVALAASGYATASMPNYKIIEPVEFSVFTIDNRMTIDYKGEVDTGIQITIECRTPPGDIIIYNVDTLERMEIIADRIKSVTGSPLAPKDIIEINTDSGSKYVRLLRNGIYYNILGAMKRNMSWFILKQGENTFTYTTTDEHAAISMTFSYRDTYAAI